MEFRETVIAALRRGDADHAMDLLATSASAEVAEDQRQAFLAMAQAVKGNHADAKLGFRLAMDSAPSAARHLIHASNFAAYLIRTGRIDDLAELVQRDWHFDQIKASESLDVEALRNLAQAMERGGQSSFIADILSPVALSQRLDRTCVRICLVALCKAGRAAEALDYLRTDAVPWRDEPEFIAIEAFATLSAGEVRQSVSLGKKYVTRSAPLLLKAVPTQRCAVMMIAPPPTGDRLLKTLPEQSLGGNYPSQIAIRYSDIYRFAVVFAGAGPDSTRMALSIDPAVVINNCTNAEMLKDRGLYDAVCATEAETGVPVINAAKNAARTSRQENAQVLAGLPGVVVPRIRRFRLRQADRKDLCRAIQAEFAFPFILRLVGPQEAIGMYLVEDKLTLDRLLSELTVPHVYVIEYVNGRHSNGCFRRMRAAVIKGIPILMRADYGTDWIVQGRKFEKTRNLYARQPELLADANDILQNPERRLGKVVVHALEQIAKIIPLDVFGVDFDVDAAGRLVFFEANATMNLLSNALPGAEYPPEAERQAMAAIHTLLDRTVVH